MSQYQAMLLIFDISIDSLRIQIRTFDIRFLGYSFGLIFHFYTNLFPE